MPGGNQTVTASDWEIQPGTAPYLWQKAHFRRDPGIAPAGVKGRQKHTPLIAMTAHAVQNDRAKCIPPGIDDYVSKPVEPEERRLLEQLLSDASADSDKRESEDSVPNTPVDLTRLHLAVGDDPVEVREIVELYLTS